LAVQTTHFIGFQGEAIAAAAAYLAAMLERPPGDPDGGPMHVDGAYSWFRRAHPEFQTVLAVPPLGYQRASRTDIHDLAWFDKLPVVRELVSAVRRARNG
ncbi:MAG: LPS biosynthesis glycosyltransferase, partial [Rhizobacter sp.]|nr:LPS biosynthesis glycosyltransferase [Rhizobacter sp.]